MNDKKIGELVTRAVALDREIRELETELKELKRALIAEAETRQEDHVPTDGDGTSWEASGADGCVARVQFPAPALKNSIPGAGPTTEKVRKAAGVYFNSLFDSAPAWKLKPDFRALARSVMPKGAAALIRLCETKSQPRVQFETKKGDVGA